MPRTKLPVSPHGGSPDDTEAMFYEALQKGDVDLLMSCWAEDDEKANAAKAAAEEALKNAKSDLDLAKAQSELAVMAAQIAALRKYRQKK